MQKGLKTRIEETRTNCRFLFSFICFDALTLEFCIFVLWILVLGFPAKLYDKNTSVRIQVNILREKIFLNFFCYLNKIAVDLS